MEGVSKMHYFRKSAGLILASICFSFILAVSGYAQSKVGDLVAPWWNMLNPPRAAAMGGCGINLIDGQAPLLNPAALGLYHLRRIFTISFPNDIKVAPNINEDVRSKTFNISGGLSRGLLQAAKASPDISLGFAYSYRELRSPYFYSIVYWYPYDLNGIEYQRFVDRVKSISIGIGLEYIVKLGIGYTNNKIDMIEEHLTGPDLSYGAGTGHDLGIIAVFPAITLPMVSNKGINSGKYTCRLIPSFAFVKANMGHIRNAQRKIDLSELNKFGFSADFVVSTERVDLFSFLPVMEIEKRVSGSDQTLIKFGLETDIFNICRLRIGHRNGDHDYSDNSTWGLGLTPTGLIHYLIATENLKISNPALKRFLESLDLSFDIARAKGLYDDDADFYEMSLSF
jgi:hypothetical protein